MELEHIGHCGQLTRVHIEIKAGQLSVLKYCTCTLGWYFLLWETMWGVRAAPITVLVYALQRMLGLQICILSCAEASHYGNFEHAKSIIIRYCINVCYHEGWLSSVRPFWYASGVSHSSCVL